MEEIDTIHRMYEGCNSAQVHIALLGLDAMILGNIFVLFNLGMWDCVFDDHGKKSRLYHYL